MRVTDIRPTKKGRYSIFLDGEFACALHVDILLSSHLESGCEVTAAKMNELHGQSQQKITRERAMRLLAARAYTSHGLYEKLLAYTDEECAAAAVKRMTELGLLDDADYAQRFAADCINLKGFSHRRTAQELDRKGIDKHIIEDTLAALEEDPEPAIAKLILRKYLRYLQDEKGVQKTVNALVRLGYQYRDIRTVIANLLEDEAYYDNW